MTRINAGVRAYELPDKLLLAEHREITRIPNAVKYGRARLDLPVPKQFCLGTGHVRFFYNKQLYLLQRYLELYSECKYRNFKIILKLSAFRDLPKECLNPWKETLPARLSVIARIESKGFQLLTKRN